MHRPPTRSLPTIIITTVLATLFFVIPVAGQPRPETEFSPVGEASMAVIITLVIGGGLILFARDYTQRTTDRIRQNPGGALLYGIGIGIAFIIVFVILYITVIGILVAIPLAVLVLILGELGYLAAGRVVVESWGPALTIAIILSAIIGGIPIAGTLLGFILSSLGLGGAYLQYRDG